MDKRVVRMWDVGCGMRDEEVGWVEHVLEGGGNC